MRVMGRFGPDPSPTPGLRARGAGCRGRGFLSGSCPGGRRFWSCRCPGGRRFWSCRCPGGRRFRSRYVRRYVRCFHWRGRAGHELSVGWSKRQGNYRMPPVGTPSIIAFAMVPVPRRGWIPDPASPAHRSSLPQSNPQQSPSPRTAQRDDPGPRGEGARYRSRKHPVCGHWVPALRVAAAGLTERIPDTSYTITVRFYNMHLSARP
jgi:hypothetical protein